MPKKEFIEPSDHKWEKAKRGLAQTQETVNATKRKNGFERRKAKKSRGNKHLLGK